MKVIVINSTIEEERRVPSEGNAEGSSEGRPKAKRMPKRTASDGRMGMSGFWKVENGVRAMAAPVVAATTTSTVIKRKENGSLDV